VVFAVTRSPGWDPFAPKLFVNTMGMVLGASRVTTAFVGWLVCANAEEAATRKATRNFAFAMCKPLEDPAICLE
jgi:hypothetical protein